MPKQTRIAFRADNALKDRLDSAARQVKLPASALAESCVEAVATYVERNGEITLPLRVEDSRGTIGGAWRTNKARDLVFSICQWLVNNPQHGDALYPVIYDALKLFCDSLREKFSDGRDDFMPFIPRFLKSHPEHCAELLQMMDRDDYRMVDLLRRFESDFANAPLHELDGDRNPEWEIRWPKRSRARPNYAASEE